MKAEPLRDERLEMSVTEIVQQSESVLSDAPKSFMVCLLGMQTSNGSHFPSLRNRRYSMIRTRQRVEGLVD